jgi:hypothetical protein
MKRTFPLIMASVAGFILVFSYFIPATQNWSETVNVWFTILQAFAFVLGGGSLLKLHLKKISDRNSGWGYSGVLLIAFFTTLFVGLGKVGAPPAADYPAYAWSGSYREIGTPFWWLFEFAFKPLTATMFAMLAFYVASAAFRAFRAKNTEAILLLGTAFIILLGRTFAGVLLTDWITDSPVHPWIRTLRLENMTVEIMKVFVTAGNRAIMIGIALGTASVALKILLGIDRSYLGSGDG